MEDRLLPDSLRSMYRTLGASPPEEFVEVYEVMADAFYFGVGLSPEPDERHERRSNPHPQYDFGEPRLFDVKTAVDERLAQASSAVRRWAKARARQRARRQPLADHGGPALGRAGGPRHLQAAPDPKEV